MIERRGFLKAMVAAAAGLLAFVPKRTLSAKDGTLEPAWDAEKEWSWKLDYTVPKVEGDLLWAVPRSAWVPGRVSYANCRILVYEDGSSAVYDEHWNRVSGIQPPI